MIELTELNYEDIYQLFRNGNIYNYQILEPAMNFTFNLNGKELTNVIYEYQLNLLLVNGKDDSKSLVDMVESNE